jgi:hypothetical protein
MSKAEPLFYYALDGDKVAGPFDLVQMAGFLRAGVITADTMTLREGELDWQLFGHRSQFSVAREIPVDATSMHLESLHESESTPIVPLPSRQTVLKLLKTAGLVGLLLVAVFFLSYEEPILGLVFLVGGCGASMIGYCLILARMLDEDGLTLLAAMIIPLYDVYYFMTNLDAYFSFFLLKYVGAMVVGVAGLAIASSSSPAAVPLKHLLGH